MTHARSGLVQRKSLLGSGAPRASEADGLRSDLVIDLTLWLTIHTQRASRFSNTSNHAYVPLNSFPFMLPNS
jgi:hypothetical protein